MSPPADSRRKGSSGRCWGGRLGGVHLRHQRRGHDPRGGTEQDQSSNRHPLPHSQQVSHLTMYDATKESMIAHFPFYLGQTQWHKSPQNSTHFYSYSGEMRYPCVLEMCPNVTVLWYHLKLSLHKSHYFTSSKVQISFRLRQKLKYNFTHNSLTKVVK